MQKQLIIGRLGQDPTTTNSATKFSVAVSEKYKDNETTEWFNCVAFSKIGEVCQKYLKKGSKVFIESKRSTYKSDDGKYFYSYIVNNLEMLDGKPQESKPVEQTRSLNSQDDFGDDLPF